MSKKHILDLKIPYWSAGSEKAYGWGKDFGDQVGFGIAFKLVEDYEEIEISCPKAGGSFFVYRAKIEEFINRYRKVFYWANGKLLIVIPRAICIKL